MIGLVVAHSKNRVIGKDGKIPWDIKEDKQRFKAITSNHVVVMGRRTYEEIGRPLPNRINVIVSNTKVYEGDNLYTVKSLSEAIERFKDHDIYIAGGSRLYQEALDIVDVMYITEVDVLIDGDTYFPEFDETKFIKIVENEYQDEINYRFVTYIKKRTIK